MATCHCKPRCPEIDPNSEKWCDLMHAYNNNVIGQRVKVYDQLCLCEASDVGNELADLGEMLACFGENIANKLCNFDSRLDALDDTIDDMVDDLNDILNKLKCLDNAVGSDCV